MYYSKFELYSKDLNNGGSKGKLGLNAKANVTMQCFYGSVTSDPGRYGSFDLSGWDKHDPIEQNLQHMALSKQSLLSITLLVMTLTFVW